MGVASNGYKHHTTNNFKKWLKEKDSSKNTFVITTPILVRIRIDIESTGFLDNGAPDIMFIPDRKILEGLVQLLLKIFV